MKTLITKSNCPECNTELNAATGIGHEYTPSKDDITVCAECGEILQFNEDLSLRSIDDGVLDELKAQDENAWGQLIYASRITKHKRQ